MPENRQVWKKLCRKKNFKKSLIFSEGFKKDITLMKQEQDDR